LLETDWTCARRDERCHERSYPYRQRSITQYVHLHPLATRRSELELTETSYLARLLQRSDSRRSRSKNSTTCRSTSFHEFHHDERYLRIEGEIEGRVNVEKFRILLSFSVHFLFVLPLLAGVPILPHTYRSVTNLFLRSIARKASEERNEKRPKLCECSSASSLAELTIPACESSSILIHRPPENALSNRTGQVGESLVPVKISETGKVTIRKLPPSPRFSSSRHVSSREAASCLSARFLFPTDRLAHAPRTPRGNRSGRGS
jgi:hypothetical protein